MSFLSFGPSTALLPSMKLPRELTLQMQTNNTGAHYLGGPLQLLSLMVIWRGGSKPRFVDDPGLGRRIPLCKASHRHWSSVTGDRLLLSLACVEVSLARRSLKHIAMYTQLDGRRHLASQVPRSGKVASGTETMMCLSV